MGKDTGKGHRKKAENDAHDAQVSRWGGRAGFRFEKGTGTNRDIPVNLLLVPCHVSALPLKCFDGESNSELGSSRAHGR